MNKILLSGTLALLLAPALTFAAYNDVSLTTSANITAGGVTLNVSGSTAVIQSITVNASNFSFTLLSGSSLQVTSATGQYLNTNADGTYIITDSCSGGTSILKFSSSANTTTITVTPSSSATCSGHATSQASSVTTTSSSGNGAPVASGGGGGGGGGSSAPVTTPVTTPAVTATAPANTDSVAAIQTKINALLTQIASLQGGAATPGASAYAHANENARFKRDLQAGSKGADVKSLQIWLNTHGYPIAASGTGSPGHETTKFGGATKAALKAFQKAVGISPANGKLGPKTRAYIAAHP